MPKQSTRKAASSPKAERPSWQFTSAFRKGAFGWKTQPAASRITQAVAEIKKVAKKNAVLAADGATLFIERLSPAIAHVDSSSGSIGSHVNHAILELVPIIATAPADTATRSAGIERLFQAYLEDDIPYLSLLGEEWGRLCHSKQLAAEWADRLMDSARSALQPASKQPRFSKVTTPCLSAMLQAEQFAEIVNLVRHERFQPYGKWAVRALAAQGLVDEAIAFAESATCAAEGDLSIAATCENILLAAGRWEEAYSRYAGLGNQGGTYLANFRAVAKQIVSTGTPGARQFITTMLGRELGPLPNHPSIAHAG